MSAGAGMNSEIEIKLRRYKNNLAIGGRYYIIFGVWTVVKLLMELTMGDLTFEYLIEETVKSGVDRLFAIIITAVFIGILFAFILIVHLVVGRNVARFVKRHDNRKRFYTYTSIVTIVNVLGFLTYPVDIMTGVSSLSLTFIASLLVDISVIFILIDLFYSAVMIEKLIKQKPAVEGV